MRSSKRKLAKNEAQAERKIVKVENEDSLVNSTLFLHPFSRETKFKKLYRQEGKWNWKRREKKT